MSNGNIVSKVIDWLIWGVANLNPKKRTRMRSKMKSRRGSPTAKGDPVDSRWRTVGRE